MFAEASLLLGYQCQPMNRTTERQTSMRVWIWLIFLLFLVILLILLHRCRRCRHSKWVWNIIKNANNMHKTMGINWHKTLSNRGKATTSITSKNFSTRIFLNKLAFSSNGNFLKKYWEQIFFTSYFFFWEKRYGKLINSWTNGTFNLPRKLIVVLVCLLNLFFLHEIIMRRVLYLESLRQYVGNFWKFWAIYWRNEREIINFMSRRFKSNFQVN